MTACTATAVPGAFQSGRWRQRPELTIGNSGCVSGYGHFISQKRGRIMQTDPTIDPVADPSNEPLDEPGTQPRPLPGVAPDTDPLAPGASPEDENELGKSVPASAAKSE
jgi:hypothetical protein